MLLLVPDSLYHSETSYTTVLETSPISVKAGHILTVMVEWDGFGDPYLSDSSNSIYSSFVQPVLTKDYHINKNVFSTTVQKDSPNLVIKVRFSVPQDVIHLLSSVYSYVADEVL